MIIYELSKDIRGEVFKKLNEIYNHRKSKEGLVSANNTLIGELQRLINKWVEEKKQWSLKEIEKDLNFKEFVHKNKIKEVAKKWESGLKYIELDLEKELNSANPTKTEKGK